MDDQRRTTGRLDATISERSTCSRYSAQSDRLSERGSNARSRLKATKLNAQSDWLKRAQPAQTFIIVVHLFPSTLYVGGATTLSHHSLRSRPLSPLSLRSCFARAGTFGFGMAVQVAGLGMGTTLTMSVIVVIGTLLPLILDVEGKLLTVSGSLVVLGLLVCAGSFVFASIALSRKDADEALQKKEKGLEMKALEEMKVEVAEEEQYSTFQKVAVCVISGVACTTLQFGECATGEKARLRQRTTEARGASIGEKLAQNARLASALQHTFEQL